MKAEEISRSIEIALKYDFDRNEAIKKLKGFIVHFVGANLQIKKERNRYRFYEVSARKSKYLKLTNERLYKLARKRYCELLVRMLKLGTDIEHEEVEKLYDLLMKFENGGIELDRVVLTQKQYRWYRGSYDKKPAGNATYKIGDTCVRSKSEKEIGGELLKLAVLFHYEEKMQINVHSLVDSMYRQFKKENYGNWDYNGQLFSYHNGACYWNVPTELMWMNAPGSVWKTYDSTTGMLSIFPDFKIMLADGTVIIWEHEGLMENALYRMNANERVSLMIITQTAQPENIILTHEWDTADITRIRTIIESQILQRLWW